MKTLLKLSVLCAAGLAMSFSGKAQAQSIYTCSGAYGAYSGLYSSCNTNNTANQSSAVATATTVLRAAATQSAGLVSNRVSAALGNDAASFNVSSNSFSASSGLNAGDMGGKAGVWVSGSWTNVEDDNADTRFDGDTYTGMAGADYQVAPNTVIGIALGYESTDIDTAYNGFGGQDGNLEGDGYTVAPYIGVNLSKTASADLTVGYSDLEYDTLRFDPNQGNRITGSTDADRYFVNAGVNGVHELQNNFRLKGRAAIFYASEDKDAYTETEAGTGAAIAVGEETTELGQALLDARLGYMYQQVEPYALVGLEYDFTKDDGAVAAGQTSSNEDDFGAKLGGGLNLRLGPNVTGGIEAYTVEFRDDYNEYAVTGGLRVQF